MHRSLRSKRQPHASRQFGSTQKARDREAKLAHVCARANAQYETPGRPALRLPSTRGAAVPRALQARGCDVSRAAMARDAPHSAITSNIG